MHRPYERIKHYKECALFVNQPPFKVKKIVIKGNKEPVLKGEDKEVLKTIRYNIYNDNNELIYIAEFSVDQLLHTNRGGTYNFFFFTDANGDDSITHKGKDVKFRLFTTLFTILMDHIKTEKFLLIAFNSVNNAMSRVKLYDILARKLEEVIRSKFILRKVHTDSYVYYYIVSKDALNKSKAFKQFIRTIFNI